MMAEANLLGSYFRQLESHPTHRWWGRVKKSVGYLIESEGPVCSVGECCEIIDRSGAAYPGESVGFNGSSVLSMPLDRPGGIGYGDRIATWGERPSIRVGKEMLGRVISATGDALDSLPSYRAQDKWPPFRSASAARTRAHPGADWVRHSGHRWISHLRARPTGGNFWRQRRRQKYADRHDGSRQLRRSHRPRPGRRARARGARISGKSYRRRGVAPLSRARFHFRPVSASPHPRRAGRLLGGGIFLLAWETRPAGG